MTGFHTILIVKLCGRLIHFPRKGVLTGVLNFWYYRCYKFITILVPKMQRWGLWSSITPSWPPLIIIFCDNCILSQIFLRSFVILIFRWSVTNADFHNYLSTILSVIIIRNHSDWKFKRSITNNANQKLSLYIKKQKSIGSFLILKLHFIWEKII